MEMWTDFVDLNSCGGVASIETDSMDGDWCCDFKFGFFGQSVQ